MALLYGLRLSFPAYPLAKLFSYASGTTNKQNMYTAADLAVALANPLSADVLGLFPSIFRDPALAYKFVLAPSTDSDPPVNPIFTVDGLTEVHAGALSIVAKTGDYTVVAADGDDVLVLADATLGNMTVTPYTAVGNSGKKVGVIKIDSSANKVTIDPNGTQTWDGQSTVILTRAYEGVSAVSDGANWVQFRRTAQPDVLVCEGRLTLESGVPVSSTDQAAKTTLYFTPRGGNRIALHDGTVRWNIRTFAELSISLAGLTASTPYDVWVYDNAGVPALELLAWTNATTRATALTTQNGVLVKSGATTRRYVGTIYINASGGQTDDSLIKRYVWSYYHRAPRPMRRVESTGSWTYTSASPRQANNSALNQLDFVIGVSDDAVEAIVRVSFANTNAGVATQVGIGLDAVGHATESITGVVYTPVANYIVSNSAYWRGHPGIGRHILTWCEQSSAVGTTTWYSAAAALSEKSGIHGTVWG